MGTGLQGGREGRGRAGSEGGPALGRGFGRRGVGPCRPCRGGRADALLALSGEIGRADGRGAKNLKGRERKGRG